MREASKPTSVPSYRPVEITIEAFAGGHRVETAFTLSGPVTPAEFANIKVAYEAGLREGLLLAQKVVESGL